VNASRPRASGDFYLREQIRAIQRELGETDPVVTEANNLRDLVEKNGLPEEVKNIAFKEIERLQQMPPSVAEYAITRNYLDYLNQSAPDKMTEDPLDSGRTKILDEQHFGLEKVKDRLLEFLASSRSRRISKDRFSAGRPLASAKTSLGKILADALGRSSSAIRSRAS